MKLQKGDLVETIDDAIQGKIIGVDNNMVTVTTNEGFNLKFSSNELIKIGKDDTLKVTNADVFEAVREKQKGEKRKKRSPKMGKVLPPMEVDLHIEKLTPSTKGMTSFDMLNLQLDTAKGQLEFALKNRIQKIVFIHGVGQGILKTELEYLFGRYDNVTYYDADYRTYGLGATEVYVYQNS
ncbi:DNA mismatch repair protein MutS [Galbibacter pacificus]|uniref:DNA mismatch repair protein MutS n=1 Tax=Galbibacter pacificus TaxID=2996052 RepID=A0ABT6FV27_9FLAO|nr:DNA mismatch repair protein MutS [Galbibacter pacificus]MDG3583403.1 DNA mismatch repair protein MutS [Galbibacter pacificus]MDG3587120.1 DNA mismatch repair protein MutS [Galbibacter pacificus]